MRLDNYPYPFENSLVAIATSGGNGGDARLSTAAVARERAARHRLRPELL